MEPVLTRARALYPRALPLLGLLAAAAAAIWPAWPPLVETWQAMPEYSYSLLLVPFIACWIATRSATLPMPAARMSATAVAILLISLGAWLVAYKASSAIGEQLMIPIILWSTVWMAFGLPVARRLAVPLACLYFAIPVWEFLVPLLQSAAVWVAETVLGSIGVPVHIDGDLVSIPEGTFKIAEACAGRRYFIVCITVAALFAGTTRMRPVRAIVFLCIAAALSILTNWIRVLTVIYAGHITNMTSYLVAKEHLTLGWFLFALLMVVVCLIGTRFVKAGTLPPLAGGAGVASGHDLLWRPAVPATVLALLVPALAVAYAQRDPMPSAAADGGAAALSLPAADASWKGPQSAGAVWQPRYLGAAALGRASYESPLGTVEVFVADYTREQRGAKLVSSANALYPTEWMTLQRSTLRGISASGLGGHPHLLRVETLAGEPWLVSYLYRVGPVVTGSAITAQLAYGVLAWGGSTPTRIAAVATRCKSSCAAASWRLASFWGAEGDRLLESGSGDTR